MHFPVQPETPEFKAACKLWDLYVRTKNEFVQRGDYDEDDDDGEDAQENPAGSTEEEVRPQSPSLKPRRIISEVMVMCGLCVFTVRLKP